MIGITRQLTPPLRPGIWPWVWSREMGGSGRLRPLGRARGGVSLAISTTYVRSPKRGQPTSHFLVALAFVSQIGRLPREFESGGHIPAAVSSTCCDTPPPLLLLTFIFPGMLYALARRRAQRGRASSWCFIAQIGVCGLVVVVGIFGSVAGTASTVGLVVQHPRHHAHGGG